MHVRLKLLPAFGMAYVAMSHQSHVAMPLSEAQLATMSPSQISLELKVLDSLKTKLLKAQGIHKVRDLETQAAIEEEQEDEEHTKTLKRQAKSFKRQAKLLKRQAKSLKEARTYQSPVKIQRLTCTF